MAEALDLSRRVLTRSDAEQYVEDKFETYFRTLDPPLTSSQREALVDFANSRIQEFFGPEVAEWALHGRLTREVHVELSRRQHLAQREVAKHAAQFVLTPEHRTQLADRFPWWRRLIAKLEGGAEAK